MFYLQTADNEYRCADVFTRGEISESNTLRWFAESQMKPVNSQLWQRSKGLARLDKTYSPYSARIIAKRIYQMLGGTFTPKKKKR